MIRQLAIGLKARFDSASGAALRAVVGNSGFHFNRAKQGSTPPYLVVFPLTPADAEYTMDRTANTDLQMQFNVYDSGGSPDRAATTLALVKTLYNNHMPAMTGYSATLANWNAGPILEDEDEGWQAIGTVSYIIGE